LTCQYVCLYSIDMHQLEVAYNSYLSAIEHSRNIKHNARKMFGAHLRDARLRLGFSVRELGDKIGVTGSLINQIETSAKSVLKKEQIGKIIELCSDAKLHSKLKADSRKEEESSTQFQPDSKSEALNTVG
jgi:ribosome-binding protein aMBF1 (putative translation factor)